MIFRVWEPPQLGHIYIVGADTSDGLPEGDFSAAEVLDRNTKVQVAELYGKVDQTSFAEELAKLGSFYNQALIAVEDNSRGAMTLLALKPIYTRLFLRRIEGTLDRRFSKKLGFHTSAKTRPLLFSTLETAIYRGTIKINSPELLHEAITCIRDAKGKPTTPPGKHDDRLFAFMIALFVDSYGVLLSEIQSTDLKEPTSEMERRRRDLFKEIDKGRFSQPHENSLMVYA